PGGDCASNVVFLGRATDNCGSTSVACSPASGSSFAKGVTVVTCTATDGSGNTNGCAFTITVNDTEAPLIGACAADVVTNAAPGQCTSTVTYAAPIATDNCGAASVACSPPSGSAFSGGVTVVTCTATDESNNTNACRFTVAVIDTEPPVITCAADTATNSAPETASQAVS